MKAAGIAGLDVAGLEEALALSAKGLALNASKGGFGYVSAKPSNLTGVGVLCMQLAGEAGAADTRSAMASLRDATVRWQEPMGKRPVNPCSLPKSPSSASGCSGCQAAPSC